MFDVLEAQKRRPAMKKISTMQAFSSEVLKDHEQVGGEVDYQVAAPTEREHPPCTASEDRSQRARMEVWQQGRLS
jgi:hypothetical protein